MLDGCAEVRYNNLTNLQKQRLKMNAGSRTGKNCEETFMRESEINGRIYYRDNLENEHYLFKLRAFLEPKGLVYESSLAAAVEERLRGKKFSLSDHIRGMVYSMLTNQTKWYRIEPHLSEIDKLFFGYDAAKIKGMDAEYFCRGIFSLKCGNMSTKAQMQALHYDIDIFEKIEKEYGSIDVFLTCMPLHMGVAKLSKADSPYKLRMLGEALVWEYLRNVGIDGAKPDTHLRRFFGKDRMGTSKNSTASTKEVLDQVDALSKETGMTKTEIDNIIWSYCADGYAEICTATPNCSKCVIVKSCKRGRSNGL